MSTIFKVAAGLNAVTAVAHANMGLQDLFPAFNKILDTKVRAAAKIGWMEGVGFYSICSILFYKIAESGAGKYERLMLLVVLVQDLLAGLAFLRAGDYKPIPSTWGTSGLLIAAYLRGGI